MNYYLLFPSGTQNGLSCTVSGYISPYRPETRKLLVIFFKNSFFQHIYAIHLACIYSDSRMLSKRLLEMSVKILAHQKNTKHCFKS